MGGTQKTLPFWFYSNTNGRFSQNTHFSTHLDAHLSREFLSEGKISFGGGLLYRNGTEEDLLVDEIFAHFENSWLQATVGVKHSEDLYSGLSAANENIFWSQNFRPLPGLEFGTSSPLYFRGKTGLGVEMSWADHYAGSTGQLSHIKIHRKSLHFVLNLQDAWLLKGGLLHFVQWGGTDAAGKEKLFDFRGYLRAISGRQYITPNNHLGSWQGLIRKKGESSSVEFFADIPFESGNGAKLGNFPDGRYGVFLKRNEQEFLVNSLLYEFYTTRSQGADDYLNHSYYQNGWSYKGNVLATPFFIYSARKGALVSNNFTAHHLGIGGDFGHYFNSYPYRLLLSYGNHYGMAEQAFSKKQDFFSTFLTTRLFNGDFNYDLPRFTLDFLFAADFHNLMEPNFGAGVSLKYEIRN